MGLYTENGKENGNYYVGFHFSYTLEEDTRVPCTGTAVIRRSAAHGAVVSTLVACGRFPKLGVPFWGVPIMMIKV